MCIIMVFEVAGLEHFGQEEKARDRQTLFS